MARTVNLLSTIKAKSLTSPGLYRDGNGLYLSVTKTGSKSWSFIYQWKGRRRQKGLGPFPLVGIAEARNKALEAARLVREGADPIEAGSCEKQSVETPSFGTFALSLIETLKRGWKNEKHSQQWQNTLRTYAAPIWENMIDDINVKDIQDILTPIWIEKQETARRVRGRMERVLDAAKVQGFRSGENPARWRGNLEYLLGKQNSKQVRHHPAMPFEDLPAFISQLKDREGHAASALFLLIHTASRTSEVINAKWEELDLDFALWTIPAVRMKARKEHRVPLSREAVGLLRTMAKTSPFLFPGQGRDKPLSNMAMLKLLERMGYNQYTVHGFRSTFRDWCGECTDFPREVAEQALAHQVGNAVERAYRRGDALEKRRTLMQAWSTYIDR